MDYAASYQTKPTFRLTEKLHYIDFGGIHYLIRNFLLDLNCRMNTLYSSIMTGNVIPNCTNISTVFETISYQSATHFLKSWISPPPPIP